MGLITGYINVLCFILLGVKYPLRRLRFHKVNAFFMKLHEGASGLLFISAIAHLVFVFKKLTLYPAAMWLAGCAAFALVFWIIAACHMMKDRAKRMDWHRWLSLALCIAIAVHMAMYFL